MGCEYGKPPVVVTVPVDDHPDLEVTDFSDTQIDTLRSTWPLLCSESSRVGVEVFVRIFREAPSVQALFQHYRYVSPGLLSLLVCCLSWSAVSPGLLLACCLS